MIVNNATDMIIWSWKNDQKCLKSYWLHFMMGSLANLSTVWDIVEFSFEATHVR